jgi:uncharacterized membrane protein YjfL (UPF0719 family)
MKKLSVVALAVLLSQAPASAQGTAPTNDLANQIGMTMIGAAIAALLFFIAFKVVDYATPGDLKQQIADGNTAMAVFVAGICIACAIIIAALVG